MESYRGIAISFVLSKLLESIILKRLDHTLDNLNIPHCLQTAYRIGLSCSDAVFATQEALLTHLRVRGHLYLCLFDLEKAFDSIELSILLKRLFAIGVNGNCWRIVLSWYSSALSRIRVGSKLSEPFSITRGVKQGSVLSPILFLILIDPLLLTLKDRNAGLSIHGSFVGAAAHTDDLRTIAPSIASVIEQAAIIDDFTTGSHLNLNSDKTEIVKISRCRPPPMKSFYLTPLLPSQRKLSAWVYGGTIISLPCAQFRRTSPKPKRPFLHLEGLRPSKAT